MSLWVDKYRPTTLDKLDYHKEQAASLKHMINAGDFPHMLVYGPSGAGKKTRIMAMLRELYGPSVEKVKLEHKTIEASASKNIELTTIASNYHIELNPSDAGIYDRSVIQTFLKEIAQAHQLDASSQKSFKVIVLTEVDKLTKDAQHALRRTMEKYMATFRLVLVCNSTSKVIPPIRSRCLGIRVAAPSTEEVVSVLQVVSRKENIVLPDAFAAKISEKSERNLRRALLMLEACRVQQYPFTPDQNIAIADWEVFIAETAKRILEEQTPQRLLAVRSNLYDLLTHCIPPDVIIKNLTREILASCDNEIKTEIVHWAAFYDRRLQLGSKPVYHLEAFVAKVMAVYRRLMMELFEQ